MDVQKAVQSGCSRPSKTYSNGRRALRDWSAAPNDRWNWRCAPAIVSPPADRERLTAVHSEAHVAAIEELSARGGGSLERKGASSAFIGVPSTSHRSELLALLAEHGTERGVADACCVSHSTVGRWKRMCGL